jgi:hypothetical protein
MQHGQAVTLDCDFDTLLAGIGYTKQCVALIVRETGRSADTADGTLISLVDAANATDDFTGEFFDPLQQLIDQGRTAQGSAR